jgi:hypothetical protein
MIGCFPTASRTGASKSWTEWNVMGGYKKTAPDGFLSIDLIRSAGFRRTIVTAGIGVDRNFRAKWRDHSMTAAWLLQLDSVSFPWNGSG